MIHSTLEVHDKCHTLINVNTKILSKALSKKLRGFTMANICTVQNRNIDKSKRLISDIIEIINVQ